MRALVRGVAASFAGALTMAPKPRAIDLGAAREQHAAYVALLRRILGASAVTQLPPDDAHPDCVFVEDAAVVVATQPEQAGPSRRTAIVARIGAPERQGEEAPVAAALQVAECKLQRLVPPATLDGGDVLQLPGSRHILVGLSRRSNAAAVAQLQAALPGFQVHGVPLPAGLHLKSAMTALDAHTLLFSDDPAGRQLSAALAAHPALAQGHGRVLVPDAAAANVLLLHAGSEAHVVMQGGCPRSQALLERLCGERGLHLHKTPRMTEVAKADGALTCCSILLPG